MSRDNRKKAMRRRAYYTGESHQQVRKASDGHLWIPEAQNPAQQFVESAVLHRLLQGALAQWPDGLPPKHPLFVESVSPTVEGLGLTVPMGDARRFGLGLVGEVVDGGPSVDEITILAVSGNDLHLNAPGGGVVDLFCAWSELLHTVRAVPGASVSSREIRLSALAGTELTGDERVVLSGLLRRIALFTNDPAALDWLLAWHQWLVLSRRGNRPRLPESLIRDLTAEGFGLGPVPCRVLGLDSQPRRGTVGRSETHPVRSGSEAFGVPPASVSRKPRSDRISLGSLVDALQEVSMFWQAAGRQILLDQLRHMFGSGFDPAEFPAVRPHLFSIVLACLGERGGLLVLADVVRQLEGESVAVDQVSELVAAMAAEAVPQSAVGPEPEDPLSQVVVTDRGQDQRQMLVDALQDMPILQNVDGRDLLLELLRHKLGSGFEPARHITTRLHLFSIVSACEREQAGLDVLAGALRELSPHSLAVDQVYALVGGMSPL